MELHVTLPPYKHYLIVTDCGIFEFYQRMNSKQRGKVNEQLPKRKANKKSKQFIITIIFINIFFPLNCHTISFNNEYKV